MAVVHICGCARRPSHVTSHTSPSASSVHSLIEPPEARRRRSSARLIRLVSFRFVSACGARPRIPSTVSFLVFSFDSFLSFSLLFYCASTPCTPRSPAASSLHVQLPSRTHHHAEHARTRQPAHVRWSDPRKRSSSIRHVAAATAAIRPRFQHRHH